MGRCPIMNIHHTVCAYVTDLILSSVLRKIVAMTIDYFHWYRQRLFLTK